MQNIDGRYFISVSHWGMFPVEPRWESRTTYDWKEVPFAADMRRASSMLQSMKDIKNGES